MPYRLRRRKKENHGTGRNSHELQREGLLGFLQRLTHSDADAVTMTDAKGMKRARTHGIPKNEIRVKRRRRKKSNDRSRVDDRRTSNRLGNPLSSAGLESDARFHFFRQLDTTLPGNEECTRRTGNCNVQKSYVLDVSNPIHRDLLFEKDDHGAFRLRIDLMRRNASPMPNLMILPRVFESSGYWRFEARQENLILNTEKLKQVMIAQGTQITAAVKEQFEKREDYYKNGNSSSNSAGQDYNRYFAYLDKYHEKTPEEAIFSLSRYYSEPKSVLEALRRHPLTARFSPKNMTLITSLSSDPRSVGRRAFRRQRYHLDHPKNEGEEFASAIFTLHSNPRGADARRQQLWVVLPMIFGNVSFRIQYSSGDVLFFQNLVHAGHEYQHGGVGAVHEGQLDVRGHFYLFSPGNSQLGAQYEQFYTRKQLPDYMYK